MEKQLYTRAEVTLLLLDTPDIITTSGIDDEYGNGGSTPSGGWT